MADGADAHPRRAGPRRGPEVVACWRAAGMPPDDDSPTAPARGPFNFADVVAPMPLGFRCIAPGRRRSSPAGGAGGSRSVTATRRSRRRSGASVTISSSPATRCCRASPRTSGSTRPSRTPTRSATGSRPAARLAGACAAPSQLALPGHRRPFLGLPARLAELAEHGEAGLDAARGVSRDAAAGDRLLRVALRPADRRGRVPLALGEAVGHLNRLTPRRPGQRVTGPDGAWQWQARDEIATDRGGRSR